MKIRTLLFGIALSMSFSAHAADAKTLKVQEQVEINAPAATVWSKVKDFGDLGAWHPAVAKTEITSGTDNHKGAVRHLSLQGGGYINEKLLAYNPKKMSYQYEIIDSVLPISHYASVITVTPQGADKTLVVWKGHFKRQDLSATPVAGQDDDTAIKTITGVYRGGLDNLKKISEQ